MPSVLFTVLIAAALLGLIYGACAVATAPPRPLALPRPRRPWSDVAAARVAASARLTFDAESARDAARTKVGELTAEVRRLRARNVDLARGLEEARAAAGILVDEVGEIGGAPPPAARP